MKKAFKSNGTAASRRGYYLYGAVVAGVVVLSACGDDDESSAPVFPIDAGDAGFNDDSSGGATATGGRGSGGRVVSGSGGTAQVDASGSDSGMEAAVGTEADSGDDADSGVVTDGGESDAAGDAAMTSDAQSDSSEGGLECPLGPLEAEAGATPYDGSIDGALETIAIYGCYLDNFGGYQIVGRDTWDLGGLFHYTLVNNDEHYVVAQNDSSNEYNPDLWSRFDWTEYMGSLYFCQIAYDAASEDEALAAGPADPNDPSTTGCNGFSWSRLTPL